MIYTNRYHVHPSDVGFVVGRGGATIQRVERNTSSRIFLCPKPTEQQIRKNPSLRPFPFFFIQTSEKHMVPIIMEIIQRIAVESKNRRNGTFHHSATTRPKSNKIRCLRGADEPLVVYFTESESESEN